MKSIRGFDSKKKIRAWLYINGVFKKGKVQMIVLIASIKAIWTKFKKLTFLRIPMLVGTMKLFLVNYVYFSNIRCLLVTDSYLKNTETLWSPNTRSSRPEVFCEKDVFKKFAKFTGKYLCQNLFFITLQASVLKKETLAQVFSCEFCEIFKNIIFYRTTSVAASERQ